MIFNLGLANGSFLVDFLVWQVARNYYFECPNHNRKMPSLGVICNFINDSACHLFGLFDTDLNDARLLCTKSGMSFPVVRK